MRGHRVDCREMCGRNLVTPRLSARPAQQVRQLAKFIAMRRASSLVNRLLTARRCSSACLLVSRTKVLGVFLD